MDVTTFNWTGGNLRGSGILNVAAGGALNITGAGTKYLSDTRMLNNNSTAGSVWSGGTISRSGGAGGETFNNVGLLTITGDNDFDYATFNNSGTLTKSGGAGTTRFNYWGGGLNNTGTINVSTGILNAVGALGTNSGTINTASGASLQRTAGFTNTGTLSGSGTIVVGTGAAKLINQGSINPGGTGATGTLAIAGDVQLSTGSNLNMELGGAVAGQFDALTVTGAATLGGTLTSTLINGFTPSSQSFDVITAGSASGSFATANLPFGVNGAIVGNLYRLTHTGGTCAGVCWDGGAATTNWTDAANWTANTLPGSADVAYLNLVAGVTVNLANSTQSVKGLNSNANNHLVLGTGGLLTLTDPGTTSTLAGNLTVTGGTLTANGPLSLANLTQLSGTLQGGGAVSVGTFNWTGGTLAGIGPLTVNTALNMPAGTSSNAWNYTFLDGKTLTNNGTATLGSNQDMGGNGADLRLQNGAAINNVGVWNINYANINNTGTNIFNNTGTLNVGALGYGGTINTDYAGSGTLNLLGDGVNLGKGGGGNGTFNIGSGTTLATSGPALTTGTLNLGGVLTGSGNLSVTNSFSQTTGSVGSGFSSIAINQTSGNLSVPALTAANAITLSTVAGDVVINGVQSTTALGSSIVARSAAGFTNNAGAGALTPGSGGRWLVYAASPANVAKGGLAPTLYQYNSAFGGSLNPAGSGFIYASPLYVDANFTGTMSSTFGSNPTATAGYILRGLDSGDAATAAAITGSAAYSNWPISATTAAGSYALQYASGLLASAYYGLTPGTAQSYTVNPAILQAITASLGGTASKVYDGTTIASLSPGNFLLSGFVNTDSASVTKTTGAYASKNVGSGILVSTTLAPGDFSPAGATNLSNYVLPASASGNIGVIIPASLTLSGLTAQNKVYDATAVATLSGALSGLIVGDSVSLASSNASFDNKNVGTAKPVTVTGLTLTGSDVGNYSFTLPTGATLSAAITPASLTLSGLTARNKVYDATTTATISGTPAFSGVLGADVVSLGGSASASFADKNVGVAKPVSVTGLTLSGADAGNYTLTNTSVSTTADITPASLTLSGLTAQNKVYDATTVATITGTPIFSGVLGTDVVTLSGGASASFADKNVGVAKPVSVAGLTLTGADAGNYSLTSPGLTLIADITPASLTLSGLTAQNKVYDATTVATITGTPIFSGVLGTDVVTLSGGASARFADKNVGVAKPVSVTGLTLTGADAGNYTLTNTSASATADITPASLTLSGLTAQNKVYDATVVATITGTPIFSGVLGADVVTLAGSPGGSFADSNVGVAKPVTVANLNLSGADAANYRISGAPGGLIADITEVPAVALLRTPVASALVQVLSTTATTAQQQPAQATSQTAAPTPPPPLPPTTSAGSGPLLLSNTTQTIGGTANTFGGGPATPAVPASPSGGGFSGGPATPATPASPAGGASGSSATSAEPASGGSGGASGTSSSGQGDKPVADKPADDKSAGAKKDDTKADEKKDDKKKDDETTAKKDEGKPAPKKLATCS